MSAIEKNFEFEGARVRVEMIDGEPWFIAIDVCNVLEIGNSRQAVTRLDDDERTVISNDGRQMNAINESGLYSLILGSRKPEARAFKRWTTREVIPTIRRTGSYNARPAPAELDRRQLALMVIEAEDAREAAEQRVAELEPRADAWDELASGDGDYAVGDAAKMLQRAGIVTGRDRLFEYMKSIGWVYRQSGRWQALQSAVDTGRLRHKAQSHRHPETGETVLDTPQVRVTMKGIEQLRIRMLEPLTELAG